jgi:hypothetical protein
MTHVPETHPPQAAGAPWYCTGACSHSVALSSLNFVCSPTVVSPPCLLCSNWFADSTWAALSLPESWLHPLYQAVLAPVRLLWHILPNYQEAYARVEQSFGIAAKGPSLTEFVEILAWVLRDLAAQSGWVLAATVTTALFGCATLSATKGEPQCDKCASRSCVHCTTARVQ